ncbi:Stp1/IreP family PP2C-type Ser/Thr phosphatase [Caldinitratiruptor microaerophilus]|uniref:Protein-serine/threonine phosphatase n=1 Tax=Caldinitratiruptor microaerophilus TaxID=671077 RepID=A0AA35CLK7_9FIRM|nr:Stp1/IreP family PP2C-type Ser/Thr phosphatase [Caldinitratiruptor microaerophilus]BDG60653.1 protein-serine/threonine phosphatase [Caldinitratiruptor microaerophilus]
MRVVAATDVGRMRSGNQDAYVVEELRPQEGWALLAVADGMGGHAAGEVASSLAVQILHEHVAAAQAAWAGAPDAAAGLREAALAAHAGIVAAQQANPAYAGMGTTLTAAVVAGPEVAIVHVGDSRAYRVGKDGEIEVLTEDHSVVGELVRAGRLTEEQAMHHPQRNLLTSALGAPGEVRIDTRVATWEVGDILILCTDGLTNLVTAAELAEAARDPAGLDTLPARLVELANDRGGYDNVTVVATVRER